MALDANILALMNDTVSWEAYTTQDGHGDPTYAAPKTLSCWIEEKGLSGGVRAHRAAHADTFDPLYDVYFDANDPDVLTFDLRDRFTITTQTGGSHAEQPERIDTFRGPNGALWVTVVTL